MYGRGEEYAGYISKEDGRRFLNSRKHAHVVSNEDLYLWLCRVLQGHGDRK